MLGKVLVLVIILSFLLVGCDGNKTTNLFELEKGELKIYNQFKENYDEEVLRDVEPLTICKMYFYARYNEDYETEYELLIKDEEYVGWTKEEHMTFTHNYDRTEFYDEFKNVEDLQVSFHENTSDVNWKYGDELDSNGNEIRRGFLLVKNSNGIWKVHFMPMQ